MIVLKGSNASTQTKYFQGNNGFTLLEVLISITLMAMLVLVLSMVLRTGFQSWGRSKERNKFLIVRSSVENLLANQLRASSLLFAPQHSSRSRVFGGGVQNVTTTLPRDIDAFEGKEHSMIFFTTYVPMGSSAGGFFKVAYLYDPDNKRLLYAQKIVTTQEDYEADPPEGQSDDATYEWISDDGWLVNIVDNVNEFYFTYKEQNGDNDELDPSKWEKEFKEARSIPEAVGIGWAKSSQEEDSTENLYWTKIFTSPLPL